VRLTGRLVLRLLHVVGEHHAGRAGGRARGADRVVENHRQLLGGDDRLHVLGADVLEQRVQVDLLLVPAAQGGGDDLAHDRHDRHAVELRVVQPGQQVHRTRSLRGQADADLARVLR
jgi:hypothetical protein